MFSKYTLIRTAGYAAVLASMAFLMSIIVSAGDLGGNCCQDLEERVAELEATTSRKGNRKVTVVVTGQVNKALLYVSSGGENQKGVIDNSTAPTSLGIEGYAKFGARNEWKAGYRLELGLNEHPSIPVLDDQVMVRHNFTYLEGPLGRVSLGHTSMATDNIGQIVIANTDVASRMLSIAPLSTTYLFGIDLPFNNVRRDLLRYDTPSMGGLTASASWANGDGAVSGFNTDHAWDVALRYAGEFAGVRFAAGAGYRDENGALSPIPLIPLVRQEVWTGSASVKHMTSGLFLSAAAGRVKQDVLLGDYDVYHLQGGWEQKVTELGATTLFGEWSEMRIDSVSARPSFWGLGVVQAIDAAALDLYVAGRVYDLDTPGSDRITTIMGGARIRF